MFLRSVNFRHYTAAWLVLLLLLIIIIPTSFAQDQQYRCGVNIMQTMEYGDTVKGVLDYNQGDFYCFDAKRGDVVTVTLVPTSGNLIPSVLITKAVNETEQALFDNALAENSGVAPMAPVEVGIGIDADNTYMIVVLGGQGTRGEFELSLQVQQSQSLLGSGLGNSTEPEATEAASDTPIEDEDINELGVLNLCKFEESNFLNYNEPITGSLTEENPRTLFCFEGKQNEIVHIRVRTVSGDLVPVLILGNRFFDGTDNTIYAQDSASNNQDLAQIVFQVPEDASYFVGVVPNSNDFGDYSIELSVLDEESLNFDCRNEPLNQLSQSQWGVVLNEDENLSVTYNVSCMGVIIMSVFGGNIILEPRIDPDGTLNFTIGDNEFRTISIDDDNWVLQGQDNKELRLKSLDNGSCDEESVAALIRGAWLMDSNSLLVLDFMCNGVAFVVNQGRSDTANYTLDDGNIEIFVPTVGQMMFSGEIEVDGDNMVLRNEAGDIPFTNTLSERPSG